MAEAREVTERHLHCFLLGRGSCASSHFQGKEAETSVLNDGCAKATCEKSMWDGR